eukprot:512922_1
MDLQRQKSILAWLDLGDADWVDEINDLMDDYNIETFEDVMKHKLWPGMNENYECWNHFKAIFEQVKVSRIKSDTSISSLQNTQEEKDVNIQDYAPEAANNKLIENKENDQETFAAVPPSIQPKEELSEKILQGIKRKPKKSLRNNTNIHQDNINDANVDEISGTWCTLGPIPVQKNKQKATDKLIKNENNMMNTAKTKEEKTDNKYDNKTMKKEKNNKRNTSSVQDNDNNKTRARKPQDTQAISEQVQAPILYSSLDDDKNIVSARVRDINTLHSDFDEETDESDMDDGYDNNNFQSTKYTTKESGKPGVLQTYSKSTDNQDIEEKEKEDNKNNDDDNKQNKNNKLHKEQINSDVVEKMEEMKHKKNVSEQQKHEMCSLFHKHGNEDVEPSEQTELDVWLDALDHNLFEKYSTILNKHKYTKVEQIMEDKNDILKTLVDSHDLIKMKKANPPVNLVIDDTTDYEKQSDGLLFKSNDDHKSFDELKQCVAFQRLSKGLQNYKSKALNEIHYTHQQLFDDFCHVKSTIDADNNKSRDHDHAKCKQYKCDYEKIGTQIFEYFSRDLNMPCKDALKCLAFKKHCRCDEEQSENQEKQSAQEIALDQAWAAIHSYFFHSSMKFGVRSNQIDVKGENDLDEITTLKLGRIYVGVSEKKKEELENELKTKSFYVGEKEDNKWWEGVEPDKQQKEEDIYRILVEKMGAFRWQNARGFAPGKNRNVQYRPKCKNIKEEVLQKNVDKTYAPLSKENWNETLRKSEIFYKSWVAQKIRTKQKGSYNDQVTGQKAEWKKDQRITMAEIVTLKLYTDFDKLQFELKKCFRFETFDRILPLMDEVTAEEID